MMLQNFEEYFRFRGRKFGKSRFSWSKKQRTLLFQWFRTVPCLATTPAGAGNNKTADSDASENVKRLKELPDSGAISQEEFEAKKREYLGL